MKKFEKSTDIPDFPKCNTPEEHLQHCKEFIEAGAIPKSELVEGATYYGGCRNSEYAEWTGEKFVYKRTKFGNSYNEYINHFEDDDGYDLFIPIKKI